MKYSTCASLFGLMAPNHHNKMVDMITELLFVHEDPVLHDFVLRYMICWKTVTLNQNALCMKNFVNAVSRAFMWDFWLVVVLPCQVL